IRDAKRSADQTRTGGRHLAVFFCQLIERCQQPVANLTRRKFEHICAGLADAFAESLQNFPQDLGTGGNKIAEILARDRSQLAWLAGGYSRETRMSVEH